jgi:hypothetical protein
MSFIKYLKENLDSVNEIIDDAKISVMEILQEYDPNIEEIEVRTVINILQRALDFRNINNGKRFFDEEIENIFILDDQKQLVDNLKRVLNFAQRQATRIEPDYYV